MSISLSPPSAGTSANPTRQQLDELDALLQRMLDLPVNKLDKLRADRPGSTPAAPRQATPPVSYTTDEPDEMQASPAPAAAPTEAERDAEIWVPLSSTWKPSWLTWKPLAQTRKQPPATRPGEAASSELEQPEPSVPANSRPENPAVWEPTPTAEIEPLVARANALLPLKSDPNLLVAARERSERAHLAWRPLGPVGRFLQGRMAYLILALLGLASLAASAVVLFIDWIGWTQ